MHPRTPFAAAALFAAATLARVAAQQPPASSHTQPPTQPQQTTAQPVTQQPGAPQAVTQEPATQANPSTQPVGTTGQMIPTPSAPCAPGDVSTALPLLDRVQRLLDAAIKDGLGKVELDRGTVDEMRAEIAQIRAAIQPVKP